MGHIFLPYLWIGLSFPPNPDSHWGLMSPSYLGDFTQALHLPFFIDLGASLGTRGCRRTGVPARKGSPLRQSI